MVVDPLSERVVRTVHLQTTEKQPDAVHESTIVQIHAASGSFAGDEVRAAIQDAVDAGQLERTDDERIYVPQGHDGSESALTAKKEGGGTRRCVRIIFRESGARPVDSGD
jgi:hypothetical protein